MLLLLITRESVAFQPPPDFLSVALALEPLPISDVIDELRLTAGVESATPTLLPVFCTDAEFAPDWLWFDLSITLSLLLLRDRRPIQPVLGGLVGALETEVAAGAAAMPTEAGTGAGAACSAVPVAAG